MNDLQEHLVPDISNAEENEADTVNVNGYSDEMNEVSILLLKLIADFVFKLNFYVLYLYFYFHVSIKIVIS